MYIQEVLCVSLPTVQGCVNVLSSSFRQQNRRGRVESDTLLCGRVIRPGRAGGDEERAEKRDQDPAPRPLLPQAKRWHARKHPSGAFEPHTPSLDAHASGARSEGRCPSGLLGGGVLSLLARPLSHRDHARLCKWTPSTRGLFSLTHPISLPCRTPLFSQIPP